VLPFLCILLIISELATARGSFQVDGWRVWNNATVRAGSHIETNAVPIRISLAGGQMITVCNRSDVQLRERTAEVAKGCAILNRPGIYSFQAKASEGLRAGSNVTELQRARAVLKELETAVELRPMSQRP
jgi:hypothetical protein